MGISMRTTIKLTAIAALCMLLAGCVQERMEEAGRDIRFGAKAPVSTLTKTVYSYHQETISEQLWERIDWENGDLIRIRCDQVSSSPNYFDYDIALDVNENIKSFATATPHGAEHGLQWGSEVHKFFAMYPSPSTTGALSGLDLELTGGSTARATAVLPADQSASLRTVTLEDSSTASYYGNMKLAYMTAAIQSEANASNVTLSFKPMVTTFFISVVNTTGNNMTLKKVELTSSSSALTGKYRVNMDVNNSRPGVYQYWDGDSWEDSISSEGCNNIYASFPSGVTIEPSNSITVALFALPHEINNLTLTVTSDETGPISLPLKYNDAFISFAGEKKHNLSNINVPAVSYTLDVDPLITYDYTGNYTPDDQEFTVTSYKTIGLTQIDTPWKTQVWIDSNSDGVQDENEWNDLADVVSSTFSWLSTFPTTSSSAVDADDDSSTKTHTFRKSVSQQDVTSHEDRLKAGVVFDTDGTSPVTHNSASNAVDLSYYDFVNRKLESARYTANTYIISGPGYYKIPVVFGNGIENNKTVRDAYNGDLGLGHLNYFICPTPSGTESSINLVSTRPWLNANRSQGARIHWEKYSYWNPNSGISGEMVTYHRGWSDTPAVSVIDDLSIQTGSGNERYIVFHVDENNIRPGNWVIAAMSNSDGTGNVCWSWQIWITDQDMTPVSIHNATRTYSVLPVNLGWTDLSKGQHYEPREAVLRFASTEKAGLVSEHTLTVRQTGEDLISTKGWSTYYQWGRKDPMTDGPTQVYQNDGMVHESIKHPSNIMYDKSSFFGDRYFDWTVNNYNNLWDSRNNSWATPSGDLPNHKTVYDPSPRKYCVPPDATFDAFTSYSSPSADGLYFPTGVGENTIFFPAAGFMNYTSAQSSQGNAVVNGYWTYHPGENVQQRASYCLRFTYNSSANTYSLHVKDYTSPDAERAFAYSVRSIAYDETAVVSSAPGTMTTTFDFYEMWGDGTGLPTGSALNGYNTNVPSSAEEDYKNDIKLTIISERDISAKRVSYTNHDGIYTLDFPDSYTVTPKRYNGFTIASTNDKLHIVKVTLNYLQKGEDITADVPTFDNNKAAWADANATYNPATGEWTNAATPVSSITFKTGSGTESWYLTSIDVNYYVDPATP